MTVSRRDFLRVMGAGVSLQGGPVAVHAGRARQDRYARRTFPAQPGPDPDAVRLDVWTSHPLAGPGPDVIVLHEITGASEGFFHYTDTLVDAGFSVHCPVFFGSPFRDKSRIGDALLSLDVCLFSRRFECWKRSAENPVNAWLTALAADVAGPAQRPVGAIGMCLTGIQPLAMLRCPAVVAPVLCQPTLPSGTDLRLQNDFGLPPVDIDYAVTRVARDDLRVLLMRYAADTTASRIRERRLCTLFAPRIHCLSIPGDGHSTLVHDPDPDARRTVVEFLRTALAGAKPTAISSRR